MGQHPWLVFPGRSREGREWLWTEPRTWLWLVSGEEPGHPASWESPSHPPSLVRASGLPPLISALLKVPGIPAVPSGLPQPHHPCVQSLVSGPGAESMPWWLRAQKSSQAGASRLLFVLSSSPSTTAIRNNFLLCPRHLRRAAGPAAALSFSRSSFFHHREPYFSRKEGEESKCGEVLPQTEHLPCPRHCIMCIHHRI